MFCFSLFFTFLQSIEVKVGDSGKLKEWRKWMFCVGAIYSLFYIIFGAERHDSKGTIHDFNKV